jgi:hypothetical protein
MLVSMKNCHLLQVTVRRCGHKPIVVINAEDLDGNARIADGFVDVGR